MIAFRQQVRELSKHGARMLWNDLRLIRTHAHFVAGVLLLVVGMLSFQSGRYCEGSPHNTYACVNPDTYYYYAPWTIALVAFGVLLVLLGVLRMKNDRR